MIPELNIREWKKVAPWQTNGQVEQDLIISRALIDVEKLLHCCKIHYEFAEMKPPTAKQFIRNMEEKLTDPDFTNDIFTVLKPNTKYNHQTAWELVKKVVLVS